MPAHAYMLASIPPKISVPSFMGYLKGKNSLTMFDQHADLKYKFGNRRFWAEEYYVSAVGLNDAAVRKCIRDQERPDILQDETSMKGYGDPFEVKPGADQRQLGQWLPLQGQPGDKGKVALDTGQ